MKPKISDIFTYENDSAQFRNSVLKEVVRVRASH